MQKKRLMATLIKPCLTVCIQKLFYLSSQLQTPLSAFKECLPRGALTATKKLVQNLENKPRKSPLIYKHEPRVIKLSILHRSQCSGETKKQPSFTNINTNEIPGELFSKHIIIICTRENNMLSSHVDRSSLL